MDNKQKMVLKIINQLASSNNQSFWADYIVKHTNLDGADVTKCLLKLVKQGVLVRRWQVVCSTYYCDAKLDIFDKLSDVPKTTICPYCQNEIENTMENVYMTFSVAKEYKKKMEENSKAMAIKKVYCIALSKFKIEKWQQDEEGLEGEDIYETLDEVFEALKDNLFWLDNDNYRASTIYVGEFNDETGKLLKIATYRPRMYFRKESERVIDDASTKTVKNE